MDEDKMAKEAVEYVKEHQKQIVNRFAGGFKSQKRPVSIFMAGSPGAGKTEFSKRLIEQIPDYKTQIVRIDPDEIRESLPCYIPGKAEFFQPAVAIAVEKIHDHVLSRSKSFLLDGTLANLKKARDNITRSLKKERSVKIQYVYQPPEIAWDFTQKRESVEGRNIPKKTFIEQFFDAWKNVDTLKKEFGGRIEVDLIVRDLSKNTYDIKFNISNIDKYLETKYSKKDLEVML